MGSKMRNCYMQASFNWVEVYPNKMSLSWSQLRKINFGDKGHNKNETLKLKSKGFINIFVNHLGSKN